jgi:hypothetical protein
MLGHRRGKVSIVTGWKIDWTERERHDIVLNRNGRGCLIFECRDIMVIMPVRRKYG